MLTWDDDSIVALDEASRPPASPLVVRVGDRDNSKRHEWRASAVCPADWVRALAECEGTFFHTPPALRLTAGAGGDPRYLVLADGERTRAIALVTLHRCRLSVRARHARLATIPAVASGVDAVDALLEVREWLRDSGIADVMVDSFGATTDVAAAADGGECTDRLEFSVPIDGGDGARYSRCSRHHQRCIESGERNQWSFRVLSDADAVAAVQRVHRVASERAGRRGAAFTAAAVPREMLGVASLRDAWGTATVAAYAGEALLCAAVLGWANGAAYYLVGGSTAEGYSTAAAAWLHWRAMRMFADAGLSAYNMGGVPAAAAERGHASHGLYRFKSGFGAASRRLTSVHWTLGKQHARSHAALRWVSARVPARVPA